MPLTALQYYFTYLVNLVKKFSSSWLKVILKASGVFTIFILFLPLQINATTWVILRTRQGEAQHAYDKDRLRADGANIIFWRRIRFKNPQASEFGEVSRAVYQERIDCQNQTLQTLFVGLYDEEQRPLLERTMPENMPSTVILPESIGELFQNSVCRFAIILPPGSTSSNNRITNNSNTLKPTAPFVPQRRPVVIDNSSATPTFPLGNTQIVPPISSPDLIIQPIAPPIVPPLLPLTPP